MKQVIAALTFVFASFNAIAAAPDYVFLNDAAGCIAKADAEELHQMLMDGDLEAWGQTLAKQMYKGKCGQYSKGDRVYLKETAYLKGLAKVRQQGSSTSLWVPLESITTVSK